MEKRRLGRTNHMSTLVIFGGAAFWEISQADANATLDLALEAGINHIDVAPQYGQAEERMGPWLENHRDKFFLGCKTLERSRKESWAELHRSLEKLHTNTLDLYQLHAVGTFEELETALVPDGAIHTLLEARHQQLPNFFLNPQHVFILLTQSNSNARTTPFSFIL
jgi:aryl-alcohol dehydrogenase-like predicted oxidoreductase